MPATRCGIHTAWDYKKCQLVRGSVRIVEHNELQILVHNQADAQPAQSADELQDNVAVTEVSTIHKKRVGMKSGVMSGQASTLTLTSLSTMMTAQQLICVVIASERSNRVERLMAPSRDGWRSLALPVQVTALGKLSPPLPMTAHIEPFAHYAVTSLLHVLR